SRKLLYRAEVASSASGGSTRVHSPDLTAIAHGAPGSIDRICPVAAEQGERARREQTAKGAGGHERLRSSMRRDPGRPGASAPWGRANFASAAAIGGGKGCAAGASP